MKRSERGYFFSNWTLNVERWTLEYDPTAESWPGYEAGAEQKASNVRRSASNIQ